MAFECPDKSHELINKFMSADAKTVAKWAHESDIEYTCVSPLLGLYPRGKADAVQRAATKRPRALFRLARPEAASSGLSSIRYSRKPTTRARRMLKRPGCVGIKIHPEEHCYAIRKHGRALFQFAAEQRAIVLTHLVGEKNSWPHRFYTLCERIP